METADKLIREANEMLMTLRVKSVNARRYEDDPVGEKELHDVQMLLFKALGSLGPAPSLSERALEERAIAFNNQLARYADRLPDEIKIQWNELLALFQEQQSK